MFRKLSGACLCVSIVSVFPACSNASFTGSNPTKAIKKQELTETPFQDGNCTQTPSFWKTNLVKLDVYLPIFLGEQSGGKSLAVTDSGTALDVFNLDTYGESENGFTKLYAEQLAAKANAAAGADSSAIDGDLADADAYLANSDHAEWSALNDEDKEKLANWLSVFAAYNKGETGPGFCGDKTPGESAGDNPNGDNPNGDNPNGDNPNGDNPNGGSNPSDPSDQDTGESSDNAETGSNPGNNPGDNPGDNPGGTPGNSTPGSSTPGSSTPGSTTPGSSTPGSSTPGSTTPGSTTPGSTPGTGSTPSHDQDDDEPGTIPGGTNIPGQNPTQSPHQG